MNAIRKRMGMSFQGSALLVATSVYELCRTCGAWGPAVLTAGPPLIMYRALKQPFFGPGTLSLWQLPHPI